MLIANIYLDSIPKEQYTEVVKDNFKLNFNIIQCLEFCDYADKVGFEIAYEKYKHFLEKDLTKQNSLF